MANEAKTEKAEKRTQVRKLIAVLTLNDAGMPVIAQNDKGQDLIAPETKAVALLGAITDMKAAGKAAEIVSVVYDPANPVV